MFRQIYRANSGKILKYASHCVITERLSIKRETAATIIQKAIRMLKCGITKES